MLPERAEQMLRNYRQNQGRCDYLKNAIPEAEADIALWRKNIAIELVGSSAAPDGMPRGTTVGNPTERMGIMLASDFVPQDLKDAERRLDDMKRELKQIQLEIIFVESWLKGLTPKETWLIERLYFDGMTYNETAKEYKERYSIPASRETMRRMRKLALKKILSIAY